MIIEKSAGAVIFRRVGKKIYYLLLHYPPPLKNELRSESAERNSSRVGGELGHWDYVKGHIEKGEKPTDTVLREAKEETGLTDLEMIPGFKYTMRYFFRGKVTPSGVKATGTNHIRFTSAELVKAPKQEIIMKFVTFYLAQTRTAKVKLSYEHIGYKWLLYEAARRLITFESSKEVLDEANKFLTINFKF